MKSFLNSLYTITKPPKKLQAIPNAVDLAMDSSVTRDLSQRANLAEGSPLVTVWLCNNISYQKLIYVVPQKQKIVVE